MIFQGSGGGGGKGKGWMGVTYNWAQDKDLSKPDEASNAGRAGGAIQGPQEIHSLIGDWLKINFFVPCRTFETPNPSNSKFIPYFFPSNPSPRREPLRSLGPDVLAALWWGGTASGDPCGFACMRRRCSSQ